MIFENFLGIKNLHEADLTSDQIKLMFSFMKFKVKDDDFLDFLETLSQTDDNKIFVRDFLKQGQKFERKVGGKTKKEEKDPVVKAKRRFQLLDEVYEHIAIVIKNN